MSEVIDRPMLGHNQPPDPPCPDLAMLAARLRSDSLIEALEQRFPGHLPRRDALMEGVYRFAAVHCDPDVLTTAAALPDEGREGAFLYLQPPDEATGTFHQRVMGQWRELTDEQVVRLILRRVTIPGGEVSRKAVSFVRQIKETLKTLERDRSAVKSVFDDAGKVVQRWFKDTAIHPLESAVQEIEEALSAYQARLDAWERTARQEEARRLQTEAAAVAEAAVRTEDPDMLDAAVEAARAVERADARSGATVANMARVRGETGGVAAAREVWTFTVTDPAAVPREWMMVDEARIRDFVRHEKAKAIGAIPGVEVKREIRTSVR